MTGGQGTRVAMAGVEAPARRDPLAQDVFDAVRMGCFGGLTGAEIIATVQDAIADSREGEGAPPVRLAQVAA